MGDADAFGRRPVSDQSNNNIKIGVMFPPASGVVLDVTEEAPVPVLFLAASEQEYATPPFRFLTTIGEAMPVAVLVV